MVLDTESLKIRIVTITYKVLEAKSSKVIIFTIIYIAIMLLLSKGFKNLANRLKTFIKSKFLKSKMG